LGNPADFLLSSGNDNDWAYTIEVLKKVNITGGNILGDKAYGTENILSNIISQNAQYTIPPKDNNQNPWSFNWWLYKEHHLVQCFFQMLKWFRGVATRYDKSDDSFLALVNLAAIMILLK
jgi:transposase